MSTYRDTFLLDDTRQPRHWAPETVKDEHWVYMHLAAADNACLYIGRTKQPAGRLRSHELASSWFPDTAQIVWFGPMDEVNAGLVERELIRAIDPPFNVKHTTRDPQTQRAPDRRRASLISRIQIAEAQLDYLERQLLALDEGEALA